MAHANPMVEALIDDLLAGRLGDADAVQRNVNLIRAEIEEYAALRAEAAAELVQARQRLAEVAFNGALRRHALQEEPPVGGQELPPLEDDPDVKAHAAAHVEVGTRLELIKRNQLLLLQALGFLLASRALAFAVNLAHLLPWALGPRHGRRRVRAGVRRLVGAVVPGFTSILWIAVLVVCFLFGLPVVGNLL